MRALGRAIAGVLLASSLAAVADAAPPLEVFGSLPDVEDAALSPDGKRVAVLMNQEGQRLFAVFDLEAGEFSDALNASDVKARGVGWANDRFALLWASQTTRSEYFRESRYEFGGVIAYDTLEQRMEQLLATGRDLSLNESISDIDAVLADEHAVLMPAFEGAVGARTRSLWRVDLATGRGRVVEEGGENTFQFVASPDGEVHARIDYADRNDRYRVFALEDGSWRTIYEDEAETAPMSVVGLSEDRSALMILDYRGRDTSGLYRLSLADGSVSGPVLEREDADVVHVLSSFRDNQVIGVGFAHINGVQYDFFDAVLDGYWSQAVAAFPSDRITPLSWSDDRTKWLLYVQGASTAGRYVLFDFTAASAQIVAEARPRITPDSMAPVLAIQYRARDGQTISGLLTVPPGSEPANLPTVIMPHGGPAAFDSYAWDWMAQYLANQGYAVLQSNYRGSAGFGLAFENAGRGEWSGAVLNDVTDGLNAMVASGYTDPERVCIVGWSFGGYLALAGAAFTPDLYKCAASIAGVSDVRRMLADERNTYGGDSSTVSYWSDLMRGDDEETRLADISPASFAENVRAPVLLIHGRDDTVVDIEQSRIMERALRGEDKPVELVVLDGEDHGLSTAETRIAALQALDGFLREHLGAAP